MNLSRVDGISTGCSTIDKIIGDGLPLGQVTLIYGEPNAGKTTLAIQCAVTSARRGLKTIFIDSDNTFSATRLSQIACSDINLISSLIFVLKPHSFSEQSLLFENLKNYLGKGVVLVVVDTISSLYRLELSSTEKIFALNRELNRQLALLCESAKNHNVAVFLISQVRNVFQEEGSPRVIEPVATRVLRFWSQNILGLKNTSEKSIRVAMVEKSSSPSRISKRCYFRLNETGIICLD